MFRAMPIAGSTPPAITSPLTVQSGRLFNAFWTADGPFSANRKTGMKLATNRNDWPGSQFMRATPAMSAFSARASAQWAKTESTAIRP